MRHFLYNGNPEKLDSACYDVLIIGSGIAGLYASLHLDPRLRVAMITKTQIEKSNSFLAQGGIASVILPDDTVHSHFEDTIRAGAGLCDEEAVKVLVTEGPENIQELIGLGVPFDTNPEGELEITREGGHSCRRIVHCGGDATGRETTKRLGEIVLSRENIDVFFETYLIDLLSDAGKPVGAIVGGKANKVLYAPNIVICTGGIGYLYKFTTNPSGAVGDGMACANRRGAELDHMEMVQFHPTTLIAPRHSERLFLISEAVRGEGGILRNHVGEAFMKSVHPMKDLAPRDIVTRAILAELKRTGKKNVFLDVSSMSEEFFSRRFPTIFGECRQFHINVPYEMIPVRPAQHYMMGGIKTGLDAMTHIDGLYACGEAACTGIHGANRLASNSMLECLVFGRRAARSINDSCRELGKKTTGDFESSGKTPMNQASVRKDRELIRQTLTDYAGAIRHTQGLQKGLEIVLNLKERYETAILEQKADYELFNMIDCAEMIFRAGLARRESVGAHYLID